MTLRTLTSRGSLIALFPHLYYQLQRSIAEPEGAPFVAELQALVGQGLQVATTEIELIGARIAAQVRVDISAEKLDRFADKVLDTVLRITNGDRTKALYTNLAGDKNPTEYKRPKHGEQYESTKTWGAKLAQCGIPELAAMAPEVQPLLDEVEAALGAKRNAQQQNRTFRDVGARQQFVDSLNAARVHAYGELTRLAHQTPTMSSDFADRFFLKDKTKGEDLDNGEEEETIEILQARAEELREGLAEIEEQLRELQDEEAAAAKAAELRAADVARLAQLDKVAAEAAAEAEALRAKLAAEAA